MQQRGLGLTICVRTARGETLMNREVVVRTKFLPTGFLLSEFH
eukprot:COSAG02_NODE_2633_length_8375_cov_11.706501_1_plen_43_part_00